MKRICVFCGSSPAVDPLYTAAAEDLGRSLVSRDLGLVYGGSDRGLMGAIANSVLAAGGTVLGVIPRGLRSREIAHEGLTELFVVESMHERKQKMVDLSDAFVAMPGGFGTIDELAEVLTWRQLGLHAKPIGLLDVNGFFEPLLRFFDQAVEAGFIHPVQRAQLIVETTPDRLLDRLTAG